MKTEQLLKHQYSAAVTSKIKEMLFWYEEKGEIFIWVNVCKLNY